MNYIIEILNNEEYFNLFQILASISTFIASIVALFTVRLIRKQITDSNRPHVVLGNGCYGICFGKKNSLFRTEWIDGEKDCDDLLPGIGGLWFEILNVGIGYAEKVEVEEYLDYDSAKKYIEKFDSKNEFNVQIKRDILKHKVLKIQTTLDDEWIRIPLSSEKRQLGNFATISQKNNKPNECVFHEEYLAFLSCISHLIDRNPEVLFLDGFPPLKIKIKFQDVDGKKYYNRYHCKPSFINSTSCTFKFIKK
ncbi:MAG: hypothetical protein ACJAWV_004009 [Flammeovirgaceae bacterium]|jgi:hypothetical protein